MEIIKRALFITVLLCLFEAHAAHAQQGFEPRPIPLGVSGGNILDSSARYCCGGTLGSLVEDNQATQYILSPNHILARSNRGMPGDLIVQPGLIDTDCQKDPSDAVATLSTYIPISFTANRIFPPKNKVNQVDAAIAEVEAGKVDPSGSILNIGQVSAETVAPTLGMPVQKNGRTSGLTSGTITAVDVTAAVQYPTTCGSQTYRIGWFTGQIMVGPSGFSSAGDSGSLVVEDCLTSPRAVGLLFAGTNSSTLLNPIGTVLSQLNVSMIGAQGYCTSSEASSAPAAAQSLSEVQPEELETVKAVINRLKIVLTYTP